MWKANREIDLRTRPLLVVCIGAERVEVARVVDVARGALLVRERVRLVVAVAHHRLHQLRAGPHDTNRITPCVRRTCHKQSASQDIAYWLVHVKLLTCC